MMDDGAGSDISTSVGTFEPHLSEFTISSFTNADTSKTFRLLVISTTSGGSTLGGIGTFILAAVPQKPAAPENVVGLTNSQQITV
jgi:hypothetical protein